MFGVYETGIASISGSFSPGQALSFGTSSATGLVESFDASEDQLKFTIQSTDQPLIDEYVSSTTATGTIADFTFRPTFEGNISPGNLFIATDEPVAYEVAGVVTRSHLTLNAQYQGTTLSDAGYIVQTSFAPLNNTAYPEPGDQNAVEVIKRGLISLDGNVVSASGLLTLSGSLQAAIDAIDASVTLQEAYDNGDGTILTIGGKPLELTGTGELTAVTGTFSTSLTVSGLPVSVGQHIETTAVALNFPGSGIDGRGDGSENVFWTINYDFDATSVRSKTVSGSLTYSVLFNDVIVEGLNDQTVTTSEVTSTATGALSYSANDEITVAISGASAAKDLRFSLNTVRT